MGDGRPGDGHRDLVLDPRDLRTLPGFTTNVEFGLDVINRPVVLLPAGLPRPGQEPLPDLARPHRHGVPATGTLPATVTAALDLIARSA